MLRLDRVLIRDANARPADATLTLPFELRRRSRLLVRLDSGEEAGLFLERGTVLHDGDRLAAIDGRIVRSLPPSSAFISFAPPRPVRWRKPPTTSAIAMCRWRSAGTI